MRKFEWDAAKDAETMRRRGFGFRTASIVFEGFVVVDRDKRRDYGELRLSAIGFADGSIIVVIYTKRWGVRRLISARPANRKERMRWLSFG
jgi:uncharacterized DUF497 family protein